MRIRGESIKYGTYNKKANLRLERNLMQEIEQLEKGKKLADLELLEEKNQELLEFRQAKIQGHVVRSRLQWVLKEKDRLDFLCFGEQ